MDFKQCSSQEVFSTFVTFEVSLVQVYSLIMKIKVGGVSEVQRAKGTFSPANHKILLMLNKSMI
jgi:hypothetical protein